MVDRSMTHVQMRYCPCCEKEKPPQNFYVGREICRGCMSLANKERRDKRSRDKGTVAELMARWAR